MSCGGNILTRRISSGSGRQTDRKLNERITHRVLHCCQTFFFFVDEICFDTSAICQSAAETNSFTWTNHGSANQCGLENIIVFPYRFLYISRSSLWPCSKWKATALPVSTLFSFVLQNFSIIYILPLVLCRHLFRWRPICTNNTRYPYIEKLISGCNTTTIYSYSSWIVDINSISSKPETYPSLGLPVLMVTKSTGYTYFYSSHRTLRCSFYNFM